MVVRWRCGPGRSPRVRGRHRVRGDGGGDPGTIPACAGKTKRPREHPPCLRDDPRVCGEDIEGTLAEKLGRGRSPRVRGRQLDPALVDELLGTIPACAGKTLARAGATIAKRDDPRVCGEDDRASQRARYIRGRSPRVRGRRGQTPMGPRANGTIPACAGKTSPSLALVSSARDDPRVCGEDSETDCHSSSLRGKKVFCMCWSAILKEFASRERPCKIQRLAFGMLEKES